MHRDALLRTGTYRPSGRGYARRSFGRRGIADQQWRQSDGAVMMNRITAYSCYRCGNEFPIDLPIDSRGCPSCLETAPSNLRVVYRAPTSATLTVKGTDRWPSLWRYAERLPFDESSAVSLGEGLTPLLRSERIGAAIGVPNLSSRTKGTIQPGHTRIGSQPLL